MIENVPIVTAATAFDHLDGNTYILIFHESLYYGTKMKHSLINLNQIRHCGLDFFDNPMRDDELYMVIDDELHVPLRFKGMKCIFDSRVPMVQELSSCEQFNVTSNEEWNPESVDLSKAQKLSQTRVTLQSVYMTVAGS